MGAKKTIPSVENVYTVAGHWVECALRKDDSLFTPGKPIWSPALLQELRSHFLERPDLGEGGFYDKLRQQLEDCSPEAYQLMAEALFVQFLIIWHGQMGQDAKRSQVEACFILGSSGVRHSRPPGGWTDPWHRGEYGSRPGTTISSGIHSGIRRAMEDAAGGRS